MTGRPTITEQWRWRFVLMWIILFSLAVAYAVGETHNFARNNHRTVVENRNTITYLCLVARSLDPTVTRAIKVAPGQDLKAKLTALHLVLTETAPCEDVEG